MDPITINTLDRKRFNALLGFTRSPAASYVSEEVAWYANEDESILGVLLHDTVDDDYVTVTLTRDEVGRFSAFEVECSISDLESAKNLLINTIKWHTGQKLQFFPQGKAFNGVDLFAPITPPEKQHPYFISLSREPSFSPAKAIINRIMPYFADVDGNFVEQFQTTGFDARLWELYINTYLYEEELFINREYNAPDFMVEKYGEKVAIEAVTVGRKASIPPLYLRPNPQHLLPQEVSKEQLNSMPIKFGSPLYSKLQKNYWELPHVSGVPLVFAIADFHDNYSMVWSSTSLINYLYGVRHNFHYEKNGKLVIETEKIENHDSGGKTIPSGFFFQPNAEYVSAILFSASGTISKFNRLGRQAGFGDPNILMIRRGACHNHDPNASKPHMFSYVVDESTDETWAEGVSMYHNPRALFPVPVELFPSIAHHRFEEGQIVSSLPEFHPYFSITLNFRPAANDKFRR